MLKTSSTKKRILFTGSSIIALWETLPSFFPEFQTVNTAVGGSGTADIYSRIEDTVHRHRPDAVCYYCGSNDINGGRSAGEIHTMTVRTLEEIHSRGMGPLCIYLSVIRAPQKRERWDVVDEVNGRMSHYCAESECVYYLDVNPVFMGPDGSPRYEYYLEDQLHYNPAGYAALGAFAAPRIRVILETSFLPGRGGDSSRKEKI